MLENVYNSEISHWYDAIMEAGVKTEYTPQLLGHKDVRTTRIYEAITTKHRENIPSPHDTL